MNPYHLYAAALLVGVAMLMSAGLVASAIDRYRELWTVPTDPFRDTELLPCFDGIEDDEIELPDPDVLPFGRRSAA